MLKSSLSALDSLSETTRSVRKRTRPARRRTLENIKLESITLNAQPTCLSKLLSLLALSSSTFAQRPITNSRLV
ncbi:hypothetical protein HKD37_01G002100 [Glycine soja]